ncbi:DUF1836 domain-containing protein [Streptococcus sciuri]|uniref:DUF1836 domain-containing protein n=1 Tax=Streptococcus sciuri TaxID=2973939 RepID=A0ABT2F4P5_9STRE|nr:DUF1836 domain-containing protein [Streptococcus sciuri]MCS4487448.1 DUF1836 domain-containing protein [Streptococcus sciuri]
MTYHYPSWDELPTIELYLDQVLLYVNQVTQNNISSGKGLTASMVNNYVKHAQLTKPMKKKYNRKHLARLIAITALKNVFSIQEISQTLAILTANGQSQQSYDSFVACMNNQEKEELPKIIISACQTLKLYDQTQQLVQNLEGEQDESNANHETE